MAAIATVRSATKSRRTAFALILGASNQVRWQSKLTSNKCNPDIYVLPDERSLSNHLLTLLPTKPARPDLALGSTSALPPTPASFSHNTKFLRILQSVVAEHAHRDPVVIGSAQAYASTAGATLGSGGAFFGGGGGSGAGNQLRGRRARNAVPGEGGGGGGASAQGGAGGAGRGGYIHVWDARRPPDFGRIPDPEDIFGSMEVDGSGQFVDGTGRYQESGTYRLLTPDGILGLSDYLKEKLIERLREEESKPEKA